MTGSERPGRRSRATTWCRCPPRLPADVAADPARLHPRAGAAASSPFVVTLLNAIPDALLALWLMLLADGVADGDRTQVLLQLPRHRRLGDVDLGASTWSRTGCSGGSATR